MRENRTLAGGEGLMMVNDELEHVSPNMEVETIQSFFHSDTLIQLTNDTI